jgi:hypothetical protein
LSIIQSKDKSPSLEGVVFKRYRILKWRGRFRFDGGVVNIVSVFKIKKMIVDAPMPGRLNTAYRCLCPGVEFLEE